MFLKLLVLFTLVVVAPCAGPHTAYSFFEHTWKWILFNHMGNGVGSDGILRGPPNTHPVQKKTIGKWIFEALPKMKEDLDIMVESETGRRIRPQELHSANVRLAVALADKYGVGQGDRVAIIGGNTIDINIAGFAVYYLAAVLSPIDTLFKTHELQTLLEPYNSKVVIADKELLETVKEALKALKSDASLISVQPMEGYDDIQELISRVDEKKANAFTPTEVDNKEVAAIVHSSGTSGTPKGVALSHYGLIYQCNAFLNYRRNMKWLHTSYFYWMSGVLVMIMTSVNEGVTRILVKKVDIDSIVTAIEKYQPKFSVMSPALVSQIVTHPTATADKLKSLVYISMTGSAVSKTLLNNIKKIIPDCTPANEYGITELSGVLSYSQSPLDVTSVGKPFPGMQIKVIDRTTNKTLGSDKEGEIVVKSPTLFVEYFGNPGETQRSYYEDGWFGTGDLGKYSSKGVLYVTGRIKSILKVDGHQVFTEEIRDLIKSKVDGVEDVAVGGIDAGDNRLPTALVVKKSGSDVTTDEIKKAVKDNLADYKQLTGGVYFIDKIPRTSTGKTKQEELEKLAKKFYNEKRE